MKLYAIVSKKNASSHGCDVSLQQAAEKRGIEYIRLIEDEVVVDDIARMEFPEPALLYRISTTEKCRIIESTMLTFHGSQLSSIRFPKPRWINNVNFTELAEQIASGLPIVPTAIVDSSWSAMNDQEINTRINQLGGFPVVMKQLGLSHGEGVRLVHTLEDAHVRIQAARQPGSALIFRKYLAEYRHYRLIVVDDEVVAAIEYHKPEDDFRTNATDTPTVTATDFTKLSPEILSMAVDAVKLRASLLGGVDILEDSLTHQAFVAEANVPCYYARAEGPTGVDISGKIIEALYKRIPQTEIA